MYTYTTECGGVLLCRKSTFKRAWVKIGLTIDHVVTEGCTAVGSKREGEDVHVAVRLLYDLTEQFKMQ